ncbi:helix-turn-helix domain-containing protein [Paenibacillus sinensis]|nr:helix-turn-helix transcriptional regulator [Paenibacillus sinensis]
MEFAEKLQSYRKQRGMSQENLAEVVGVSRQAVSKWESGQSYPEMDKMIVLSELFSVSVDHLVKDVPNNAGRAGDSGTASYAQGPSVVDLKSMFHYEYKSKRTFYGVPLVHIHFGRGLYVAKGVIAIGNIAVGALSIGIIAIGGLCLGALALGLISLAGLALGLLLAVGGVAVGALSIGGLALGILAIGGMAAGVFSFGGFAVASHIAIGGYASGHIAIGDTAKGAYTLAIQNNNFGSIKAEQVRQLINQEYPHLWKPLAERIISFFN